MACKTREEPSMDEQFVKQIIEKAIQSLFASQPDLFRFTQQSNQTEWNLRIILVTRLAVCFPTSILTST
jgi:hypothetical protein